MDLSNKICAIKDYPKEGIIFRDITTLLMDRDAFKASIDQLSEKLKDKKVDKIVGIEARGFIFGAAVAYKIGAGFVPVRKPGKLPREKVSAEYELEYGKDKVEMHLDSIKKGENVVIIDDLLATGGTSKATAQMVEKLGGKIQGLLFLVELISEGLNGRENLKDYTVESLIKY